MDRLKKICMIVGSGRGTGLVIARMMAQDGIGLVLTEHPDRFQPLLEQAMLIELEFQIPVICFPLDIRNIDDVIDIFSKIKQQNLILDYLVCNAGINRLVEAIKVTEEIWDEINDVNVKGTFFVMQQAAKIMILNHGGSTVAIASQHGIKPNHNRAPYCASKAALIQVCKELALEWALHSIRVNVVSPTYILYEHNKDILLSPKGKREYLNSIPMYKYCSEKDVAEAVVFLLSDKSLMITGHNLVVDGGWVLK